MGGNFSGSCTLDIAFPVVSEWYQHRHSCLTIVLGCGHKETRAACIALLTTEGSSLLSASITSHAQVAVPTHHFPTRELAPATPTQHLLSPLLPRLAILAQRRQFLSQSTLAHRL
jgi:hypothetical protein